MVDRCSLRESAAVAVKYRLAFEQQGVWDVVSGKDTRPTGLLLNRNRIFDRWFGRDLQEWERKDALARNMMLNDRSKSIPQEIEHAKPEAMEHDTRRESGTSEVCSSHTAKEMWEKVQMMLYPVTLANGVEAVSQLVDVRPIDYPSLDAFLQAMKTAQICVELQGLAMDSQFVVSIAINKLDALTKYFVTMSMEQTVPEQRTLAAVADHTVAWGSIFIGFAKRGFSLVMQRKDDPAGKTSFREMASDAQLTEMFEKVLGATRCGEVLGRVADELIGRSISTDLQTWYTATGL